MKCTLLDHCETFREGLLHVYICIQLITFYAQQSRKIFQNNNTFQKLLL